MRLILVLLLLLVPASRGQDVFEQASGFLLSQDYVSAEAELRRVLDESVDVNEQGAAYYGLGVCAYRRGDLPEAVRFFRSCLARLPEHEAARSNLAFIERRLFIQERPAAEAGPGTGFAALLRLRIGLPASVVIQVLLVVAAVLLRRRPVFLAAILLLLASLIVVTAISEFERTSEVPSEAVVGKDGADMRVEPHIHEAVRLKLAPGSLVIVDAQSKRWALVRKDGVSGWVDQRQIRPVE